MKYGILVHKKTSNLGDDIQSLACELMLPQVDYIIDRDNVDIFSADEPVKVIMAAWWSWKKWNWPPSPDIIPLFVGYHYQDMRKWNWWDTVANTDYLSTGIGKDYYIKYSPVGCRDYETLELMNQNGIPAFFSGCITMTIDKSRIKNELGKKEEKKEPYIVICDVSKNIDDEISREAEKRGIEVKHITHNIKPEEEFNWEIRRKKALEVLNVYSDSLFVVTPRLHATLPCMAMGTKVYLARETIDNSRFVPYIDWINLYNRNFEDMFSLEKKSFESFYVYRDLLKKYINDFVINPNLKKYGEICPIEEINKWRVMKLRETCFEYKNALQNEVSKRKRLEREKKN